MRGESRARPLAFLVRDKTRRDYPEMAQVSAPNRNRVKNRVGRPLDGDRLNPDVAILGVGSFTGE